MDENRMVKHAKKITGIVTNTGTNNMRAIRMEGNDKKMKRIIPITETKNMDENVNLEENTEELAGNPGTSNDDFKLPSTSTSCGQPDLSVRPKIWGYNKLQKLLNIYEGKKLPKKLMETTKIPKMLSSFHVPPRQFSPALDPIPEDPEPWDQLALVELSFFIQDEDYEAVAELVWNKPQLLFCADVIPKIELEGHKYSMLDLSVTFNSPDMCQLLLDILEHPGFPRRLFP